MPLSSLDSSDEQHTDSREEMTVLFLQFREEGDDEAMRKIWHRYNGALTSYIAQMGVPRHDADDVLQNAFLNICKKPFRFDANHNFEPWLYCIVRNCAIDYLRKCGRHPTLSLENAASAIPAGLTTWQDDRLERPLDVLLREEEAHLCRAQMSQLPKKYLDVVYLRYFMHRKYAQIAASLQIPVGTVKSRMDKAMKLLKCDYSPA